MIDDAIRFRNSNSNSMECAVTGEYRRDKDQITCQEKVQSTRLRILDRWMYSKCIVDNSFIGIKSYTSCD